MPEEPKPNPSQAIIDAHNTRTRIVGELQNANLTDEDRDALHAELYESEQAYQKAVGEHKPKTVPGK